ncbi:MAG: hypothetical protein HDT48_00390 [Ruminococcaceae bacterium]|nr:hypothetical protein [Oscillospiraceae bacterium]
MKKFISVLLSVVMMMSVLSVGASAAIHNPGGGIMPMYDSSYSISSTLSIKNKTAECKSAVIMYQTNKWIKITQTVEIQASNGTWSATSNVWTKNADNNTTNCIFSNSISLSKSGNYRLKTETVTESSSGKRETVTVYSKEVSM